MSRFSLLKSLLATTAFSLLATAGEAQDPPAADKSGLAVAHVGNSHSHYLRLITPLAIQTGHPGHRQGEINILGAALEWNWEHGGQNKWPEVLAATNRWDAITLLSWGGKDEE